MHKLHTCFLKFLKSFGLSIHRAKIWRALPRGHLRIKNLHTFYLQFFCNPPPFTHPVKIWRALPRGHLRVRKLHTFNSENFGNPRAFPPPPRKNLTSLRGHLRVKKIHAFCFQNFGNPRAFPLPPRKNWRALPPGAPACQKIACILFQTFWQSNLASATAGAPACQKFHTFYFQLFCNPPALQPTPKKIGKRYRGGTCVSKNCMHFISNFFRPPALACNFLTRRCPRGSARWKGRRIAKIVEKMIAIF